MLDFVISTALDNFESVTLYSVLLEYKILDILISRWRKKFGWPGPECSKGSNFYYPMRFLKQ